MYKKKREQHQQMVRYEWHQKYFQKLRLELLQNLQHESSQPTSEGMVSVGSIAQVEDFSKGTQIDSIQRLRQHMRIKEHLPAQQQKDLIIGMVTNHNTILNNYDCLLLILELVSRNDFQWDYFKIKIGGNSLDSLLHQLYFENMKEEVFMTEKYANCICAIFLEFIKRDDKAVRMLPSKMAVEIASRWHIGNQYVAHLMMEISYYPEMRLDYSIVTKILSQVQLKMTSNKESRQETTSFPSINDPLTSYCHIQILQNYLCLHHNHQQIHLQQLIYQYIIYLQHTLANHPPTTSTTTTIDVPMQCMSLFLSILNSILSHEESAMYFHKQIIISEVILCILLEMFQEFELQCRANSKRPQGMLKEIMVKFVRLTRGEVLTGSRKASMVFKEIQILAEIYGK